MTRESLGYLLLALLVGSVAGFFWYLSYNSRRNTWLRDERRRREARRKAEAAQAAET